MCCRCVALSTEGSVQGSFELESEAGTWCDGRPLSSSVAAALVSADLPLAGTMETGCQPLPGRGGLVGTRGSGHPGVQPRAVTTAGPLPASLFSAASGASAGTFSSSDYIKEGSGPSSVPGIDIGALCGKIGAGKGDFALVLGAGIGF